MFLTDKINQVDASHPADLLRELREGGDGGFADAVKVAVDAGVHACHGDGERDDAKERGGSRFQQQVACDRFCVHIDAEGADRRERHCKKKTRPERAEGVFVVAGARLTCHIFGDGGLDAGYREGEGEGQHGGDELVEAHALRAEYAG